jgi:hypothetical protein
MSRYDRFVLVVITIYLFGGVAFGADSTEGDRLLLRNIQKLFALKGEPLRAAANSFLAIEESD